MSPLGTIRLLVSALVILITLPVVFLPLAIYIVVVIVFARKKSDSIRRPYVRLWLMHGNLAAVKQQLGGDIRQFYDEGGFLDHTYAVQFPANKTEVIRHDERFTFIQLGKKVTFLKRMKLPHLYGYINLIWVYFRVLSLWPWVRSKVSFIRAPEPHLMGMAALLLSRMTGVPFCISVHSNYDLIYQNTGSLYIFPIPKVVRRLIEVWERFVYSHTPYVLPVREHLAHYAVKHGAKSEAIHQIPHGIDMEPFRSPPDASFKAEWGLADRLWVISMGRIHRERLVFDLIDIAKKLGDIDPRIVVIQVGGGPHQDEFFKEVNSAQVGNFLKTFDFQSYANLVDFRQNAEVNLCLYDGYTLIEAAASGRPVVAYDIEWHSELIRNEETGLLVKVGNTNEAVKAILKLINDPKLSTRLGEKARHIAFTKYEIGVSARNKAACYRMVMGLNAEGQ